jgi:hypothetical protein
VRVITPEYVPARSYAFEFDPARFKNTSIKDEGWIFDSDFNRSRPSSTTPSHR